MNPVSKFVGFILENWRTLALIYVIGAAVTFIGTLAFFWWVCKAEDKERELYPEDYYYPDETDGATGTAATMTIALFVGIGCAILWVAVPVLFLGVWIYGRITEKFPALMGHMADDFDDEEKEEIQ